jgi:hypothetical protein
LHNFSNDAQRNRNSFKAIQDVLIGQEKTINDYDAEIYRLTHEVQNLNTQNADLQLGLAKNMTSRSSPEVVDPTLKPKACLPTVALSEGRRGPFKTPERVPVFCRSGLLEDGRS